MNKYKADRDKRSLYFDWKSELFAVGLLLSFCFVSQPSWYCGFFCVSLVLCLAVSIVLFGFALSVLFGESQAVLYLNCKRNTSQQNAILKMLFCVGKCGVVPCGVSEEAIIYN